MALKHTSQVKTPNLSLVKDDGTRKTFHEVVRLVYDGFKDIYEDLSNLDSDSTKVTAAAVITDNAIVRGDGGARGVQESTPTISDAGRISNVTDPSAAQDAATKASSEAAASAAGLWEVDGTEHQLKTADEIDMQSKKIINVTDPASAQDAATKKFHDDDMDAEMNTSTGHDHDGSDSKKVIYTNLDLAGITNGHILYSNGGVPAGKEEASSNLSNVIFEWYGGDLGVTNQYSLVRNASKVVTMSGIAAEYVYWGVYGNTTRTILTSVYEHIAGISTVKIHSRLWASNAGATLEAIMTVDIGGQSSTVKSVTSTSPTWYESSVDIDVSGLTPGTKYTITISLENEDAGRSAYCSGLILTTA